MAEGVVEIILRAVDEFSGTMSKITSASGGASNIIVNNWKSIALAAGAAGVALEGYARMQAPLIESTNKIAIVSGLTAKAVKDLALDTADASFSLKDALKVMEEGASQGLKSGDALKTYASFWDTVGDASGENSATLANSSVSLRNFGIDAENVSDAAGAYGYILTNTSLSVSEFNGICARSGPALSGMGLSVDQVALIVGKLEEKGVVGRKAITAITDAAQNSTSLDELYGRLGITSEGMDTAGTAADTYAGKLKDMAKAHDDTLTPMQKISSYLQEVTYKLSGVISIGAYLAPVFMGIAAAVPIFANLSIAAAAAGGVMPLLAGGLASVGAVIIPLLPLIAGVAAAAVILYAAWKTNFMGIQDVTKKAADFVKDQFEGLKDTVAKFGDKIAPSIDKVKKAFGEITTAVDNLVKKLTGSSLGELIGKLVDLFGRLIDIAVSKFFDLLAIAIGKAADVIVIISDKISDFLGWCDKIASHPVAKFFLDSIGLVTDFAGALVDKAIPATDDTSKSLDGAKKAADGTTGALDTLDKQGSNSLSNLATNAGVAADTIAAKLGGVGGAISTALDKIKGAQIEAQKTKAAFNIELGNASASELAQFVRSGEGTEAQNYEALITLITKQMNASGATGDPSIYARKVLEGAPDLLGKFFELQQKHYAGPLEGQWIPTGSTGGSSSTPQPNVDNYPSGTPVATLNVESGDVEGLLKAAEGDQVYKYNGDVYYHGNKIQEYGPGGQYADMVEGNPYNNPASSSVPLASPSTPFTPGEIGSPSSSAPPGLIYNPVLGTYQSQAEFNATNAASGGGLQSPSTTPTSSDAGDMFHDMLEVSKSHMESTAAGGGLVTKGGKLTVGEEGYELLVTKDGKDVLVGLNGPEEINVNSGDMIVPQSVKGWNDYAEETNSSLEEGQAALADFSDTVKDNTVIHRRYDNIMDALIRTMGQASSATQRSESYISNWHNAVVDNSRVADVQVRETSSQMYNSVMDSNATTAGNIASTHDYIGRTSVASAGNIAGTTNMMFRAILEQAAAAAEAAATIGCKDGSCGLPGGLDFSSGGAGSPIVYDGSTSYGGSTIVTGYDYVPIRSTATSSRLVSDRYATSRYAVPAMASGGEVRGGGKAIVGENGAEFVELPDGARVTPLKGGEDDFVSRVANKILARLGPSSGRQGDIHLHGVFIADKSGLMKLNKEIEKVKVMEDGRRGRRATA